MTGPTIPVPEMDVEALLKDMRSILLDSAGSPPSIARQFLYKAGDMIEFLTSACIKKDGELSSAREEIERLQAKLSDEVAAGAYTAGVLRTEIDLGAEAREEAARLRTELSALRERASKEAGEWKPISEADEWEVVLTYSPPENLYENPDGRPGEIRYTCRHNNTWATHFLKIELPPFPSSQTGAP